MHVLIISSMLAKFQENQRSTVMSSIKCLNFKFFCSIKLCTKNKYIIQFEQNLTYMSRTYETCNSTIRFSKFTSNKKCIKRVWWVWRFWREILSVIYYLDRYLSHCLWIGTPLKHPLRHLRQFFLLGFVHFSRNSSIFFFFFFWKQIICFFQIMSSIWYY